MGSAGFTPRATFIYHPPMRSFQRWRNLIVALLVAGVARAQDGSFTHAGLERHYTSAGTGESAVFLSGGPGLDVGYIKPVAEFLPDSYRRIFLEQRGTGRSRPASAESLTLKTVVGDLEALRQHLKQQRLFLIGHSWGGLLAMAYAAEYPEHVERLVLIGSTGPTPKFLDWFVDNINARLRPEDIAVANYWKAAASRGVAASKVDLEIMRARTPGYFFERAKGLEFAAQAKEEELYGDVMAGIWKDLRKGWDLSAKLKNLARPVLIVQGHQDPMGDKTAEEIHAAITGSTLAYIKRSGHFPWLEQPDRFPAEREGVLGKASRGRAALSRYATAQREPHPQGLPVTRWDGRQKCRLCLSYQLTCNRQTRSDRLPN